jgi:hypothetical protein
MEIVNQPEIPDLAVAVPIELEAEAGRRFAQVEAHQSHFFCPNCNHEYLLLLKSSLATPEMLDQCVTILPERLKRTCPNHQDYLKL